MKKNLDKIIAQNIVSAQRCSEYGKGRQTFSYSRNHRRCGYGLKPLYIIRALSMVMTSKGSSFRCWTTKEPDQNGFPSYISYIDWKDPVDGKRYQVSFHTPEGLGGDLERFVQKGRPTHWAKTGSNNDTCYRLIERYGIK